MNAFIFLHLYNFFSDRGVLLSIWNGFIAALSPQIVVSLLLGLPGAIYVCLKIYREFIKPTVHPQLDEKLKEKATKAALSNGNGHGGQTYGNPKHGK